MIKNLLIVYNDFFEEPRENAKFMAETFKISCGVDKVDITEFSKADQSALFSRTVSIFIDYLARRFIVIPKEGKFVIPSEVAISLKSNGDVIYREKMEFPDRWNVAVHMDADMEDIPNIKMVLEKFMKKVTTTE